MSFYLSNSDVHPTGYEPGEFLDLMSMAHTRETTGAMPSAASPGPSKAYVGSGITVFWDAERCVHAERCTSGGPAVFDRDARPWISPDRTTADELAAVIDTCPSGALSYTRTDGSANGRRGRTADEDPASSTAPDPELSFFTQATASASPDEVSVTITPQTDGPLVIEGPALLALPDGSTEPAARLALCRCGQSRSKPHCDGTHARVGFRAAGPSPDPASGAKGPT